MPIRPPSISIIGENNIAAAINEVWQEKSESSFSWNSYEDLEQASLVFETTATDKSQKRKQLQNIEKRILSDTVIVSSTLQWTATEQASWLENPSKLIGFGALPNQGPFVEVAPALQASDEALTAVINQLQHWGLEVDVVEDEVGLVFPRIISLIINEAAFVLTERSASAEDIDLAMKKGTNYPYGPLEWAEILGIDNIHAVLNGLHHQLGEEKYRPASLIKKLVHAGWTGRETGKGFYYYEKQRDKEALTLNTL